jgi:hypothetical protein
MSTCISKATADKVGLLPIGKVQIYGVSGPQYHNNYLFHLGFTIGQATTEPAPNGTRTFQGQLTVLNNPIQGAEFDPGLSGFDVLLGMDVISIGSLAVEGGSGTFSWAW